MPTRGQVRRAIEWEAFRRIPRLKRSPKKYPPCVTCGAPSTHEFAKGEPGYGCGPHEPLTVGKDDLERGRREFGA